MNAANRDTTTKKLSAELASLIGLEEKIDDLIYGKGDGAIQIEFPEFAHRLLGAVDTRKWEIKAELKSIEEPEFAE